MPERCQVYAIILTAIAAIWLVTFSANAHDFWIGNGNYKSPADGAHCCGAEDCFEVPGRDVKASPGGYLLNRIKETVPYSEAMPSEDGKYWRCQRPDGSRRCFFAPLQGF